MQSFLRFGLCILVCLLFPMTSSWAAKEATVLTGSETIFLSRESPGRVLVSSSPDVTEAEARKRFTTLGSAPTRSDPCGYAGCWIAFPIQNGYGSDQDILIGSSSGSVQIWVVTDDGSKLPLTSLATLGKESTQSRSPYQHFLLHQGETVTVLERIQFDTLFPEGVDALGVVPYPTFLEDLLRRLLLAGLLVGGLVALGLYNAFLARASKDRSYYFYCLYLFFMALSSFDAVTNRTILLFPSVTFLNELLSHSSDCLMWISLVGFARSFLETKKYLPRFDRLWLIPVIFGLGGFAVGILGGNLWIYPAYIGFALPAPIGMVAALLRMRQGDRGARYFLAAQVVLSAGVLLQTFQDFGFISFDFRSGTWIELIDDHVVWVASLIEAVLFSLALADRFKTLTQTVADQTINHMRDRELLISAQKTQLEIDVSERTQELQLEKTKADQLLLSVLPTEVAEELKRTGHSKPRRYDDASILFTDFRNFTTTVSALPADRLVAELNEIFQQFDEILLANGVEKIKTIGDSYMVASGLPQIVPDHAERCVASALQMLAFIARRNEGSAIKWGMRAGIHSGAVVAGIVGKTKFTYDVFGDTVNIASRMESNSEPGRLSVSAYTYDLIKGAYQGTYRGKIEIKGKGEIDMYFID